MRVTVFGTLNEQETGPSQVTAGLTAALARSGLDVELLSHGNRTRAPHPDVKLTRMGRTPSSVLGFLRLYRQVRNYVAETSPDVFHALEDYSYGADVRTIQWAHTSVDLLRDRRFPGTNVSLREFVGELPLYTASRFGASRSNYLVAQSPVTERQINEYWRLSSDEIIPLGIDEDVLVPPQSNSDPIRVLFPGRITPKKGQQRVLKHLSPDADDYQVDIVGSTVDENYVDNRWKNRCHGFVSRECLTEFYTKADIVVVPSYHENFSVTALEAIAHGCVLVVASDCGFAQFDQAKDSDGIHVFNTDDKAAQTIRNLAVTHNLTIKKQRAFELAQNLTWKETTKQYIAVYQNI